MEGAGEKEIIAAMMINPFSDVLVNQLVDGVVNWKARVRFRNEPILADLSIYSFQENCYFAGTQNQYPGFFVLRIFTYQSKLLNY